MKLFRNSTIFRGALFSIFSFFNKGLNFILLLVLAKFLAPDAYGELSLCTTLITLLGYIICLSSEGYAAISYFKESESEYRGTISSLYIMPCVIIMIIIIIVYIGSLFSDRLFGLAINDVYCAVLISYFSVYIHLLLDYFRVKEKIITYGIISCSYALLSFTLTLFLIITIHLGWHGRVYSLLVAALFYSIFSTYIFIKDNILSFSSISLSSIKKIIAWGVPLIPHLASTWIKQGGDRYIINASYDVADVGIFSFALNLANIMAMVGMAFNSSNSVDIYKSLSNPTNETFDRLRNYTKKMFGVYGGISIVILVTCMLLIPILLPQYAVAMNYYYLMVPYGFLQCLYFLYCNYLFYYGENKQIMNITFFTSIIHLLLSFILTRYSLYATAMVYSLTQLIILVLLRIKVSRLLKNNLSNYGYNWVL